MFCQATSITPFPVSELYLCRFAAWLAAQNLRHQSIKCYLSGIRSAHILAGFGDPQFAQMSILEYLFWGIKSLQAKQGTSPINPRFPITNSCHTSQASGGMEPAA